MKTESKELIKKLLFKLLCSLCFWGMLALCIGKLGTM